VTRVVIAGGGPGGLEAALALHALAGDRVGIELVADAPSFVYRPWSVAEPFGLGRPVELDVAGMAAERGWSFRRAAVTGVDAAARRLQTSVGPVGYDVLVVALGARRVPAVAGALPFRGPRDVRELRTVLERVTRAGAAHVAYVATPSASWTLPAYELALLTHAWAGRRGTRVAITVVTGEDDPLEAFGPAGTARIRGLLDERGIGLRCRTVVESFDGDRLLDPGAAPIHAHLAVALPAVVGPSLPGLPHDAGGFIPVDETGRARGIADVFAVGDITDHRPKQGGLATQQADVVAARIARAAGAVCETPAYAPVLRAVLLTGDAPAFLRHPPAPDGKAPHWWPPHKIAGRHLAPYLATHADLVTTAGV
jgi:sulfide:quinone oxidoreductase